MGTRVSIVHETGNITPVYEKGNRFGKTMIGL